MLHHYLRIILSETNEVLCRQNNLKKEPLMLAVAGSPGVDQKSNGGLFMRLLSIHEVSLRGNPNEYVPKGNGFVMCKMPQPFSMHILFSPSFQASDLLKNLDLLAQVAVFFHHKPSFTLQNTPALQEIPLEPFNIEWVNMEMQEQISLWQGLHLPYSPSLLYKVSVVFLGEPIMGDHVAPSFSSFQKS